VRLKLSQLSVGQDDVPAKAAGEGKQHDDATTSCPKIGHALYIASEFETEGSLSIRSQLPAAGGFPARDVEACIRDALDAEHGAQRVLRPQAESACAPEVDSLVVVEVICAIEELLGVTLPTSFAPRGGYDDVEVCVADLLAQTRGVWVELRKQGEEQHA
jgi:acyl carrier protein